jgi:hypothetical protein
MRIPCHERELTSSLGYMPDHQFPGVYASIVTENTLQSAAETLYPGEWMLFLDARLLKDRKDYHFNVSDQNGYIGIDTLYPWDLYSFVESGQLVKAIDKCGDDFFGNEVVFHNPIPWSSVCKIKRKKHKTDYDVPTLPNFVIKSTSKHFRNVNHLPYFALPTLPTKHQNGCTKDPIEIERKTKLLNQAWTALMQSWTAEEIYCARSYQDFDKFQQFQQRFNLQI